ncbi:MAG: T9SS type A sorting domain-containing protein [Bacteroidales bacterium]|nr:T9SS type A sorting domain-containing protein [Bacteroidales bacterium]
MKNFYFLIILGCFFTTLNSQTQRLILFEEFTNASCGPCAATNPALDALLQANSNKIVAIKYHTNWPGTDPMNAQNSSDVSARVNYYSVEAVPHGIMDGNVFNDHPGYFTQTNIDNEYNIPSPFQINLTHQFSLDYDSIYISCTLICKQAISSTQLKLRIALIEKVIEYETPPGSNGETIFYDVMRKMIPNANGTTLPATWNVNDSQTFNFGVAIPTYIYDKGQLAVVAFIQDDTNKNVKQAARTAPQTIPLDAKVIAINNLPSLTCNNSISNISISFKNNGTNPITFAQIKYWIDSNSPQTIDWTGNLVSGQTTQITIPTIYVSHGKHTLNVEIVNPNNQTDYNSNNNKKTKDFNVVHNIISLPITQTFSQVAFPPNNWFIIDVDNDGYKWVRASSSHSGGVGSAKIAFYDIPIGKIDDLFTTKIDLSNAQNCKLTFWIAHAQYNFTYQDKLQVDVSTDCGATWTTKWAKTGPELATTAPTTSEYIPSSSHWRQEEVWLTQYIGYPEVMIRFRATSGYSNNLYLDDIYILDPLSSENKEIARNFTYYVNDNKLNIEFFETPQKPIVVSLYNSIGQELFRQQTKSKTIIIDLSKFDKGIYLLKVENNTTEIRKIIK